MDRWTLNRQAALASVLSLITARHEGKDRNAQGMNSLLFAGGLVPPSKKLGPRSNKSTRQLTAATLTTAVRTTTAAPASNW